MENQLVEATDINALTAPPNGDQTLPRLWGRHTILSGVVTLALLAVLATFVDWQSLWREFLLCQKGYILLGAGCHYLTYPLRGLRWRHCLNHLPIRGSRTKFGLVVFFYNFVDNVVPAKLGDLYAAHMARINFGIRRSEAMGSIVFLRMLDAWIILSVALLVSLTLFSTRLPNSILWALVGGGLIASGATAIMVVFFFLDRSLPGWVPEKLKEIIQSFRKGMWPRPSEIIPISLLTVLIWGLETLWIMSLVLAFGLRLSPAEAIFVTMVPLLASAFPLTPSGTGAVELTLFSCLRVVGVSAPIAVSLTVVNRFIDYWLHIGLGLLTWAMRRMIGLRAWREAVPEDVRTATSPETALSQEAFHGT